MKNFLVYKINFMFKLKILNDKSLELSKEVSNNQKIKSENDKILKDSQEMLKKNRRN